MIGSIRHKGLKRLYENGDRSKLPPDLVPRVEDILGVLDIALTIEDMDLPQFRLHELKGDRKGQWSVTVRANWRIVFRFENGEAEDIDFVDYH
jgi:proteic killer suppression protein